MKRLDASQGQRIVGPRDGQSVELGAIGVRFMMWGEETGGGFSLVEHPIPPRTLAAPVHRHAREDEYSYVLEGRHGRAARRRRRLRGGRATSSSSRATSGTRSGTPATSRLPDPRDHLAGGLRALLRRRSRRLRSRAKSSARATASRSTSTASPTCARSTDCACRVRAQIAIQLAACPSRWALMLARSR